MLIDYSAILGLKTEAVPYSWRDREVMLCALGIGMDCDALNEKELQFVKRYLQHPSR
ncbi:hypothetical protein GA0061098_104129 [Bradyrhizobium shewense]|uniref:Uncharacterized protein n=1 Tax=Bradyrhizobium shewense TaxID=1761772 RepID=A0A1C3XT41_9BRAD|nr:hypothetical protein [Bradyrhizobium shewense]SCB55447.1 hypothetical protein GA0061098_104129 [Bradyrhizobium shewense]